MSQPSFKHEGVQFTLIHSSNLFVDQAYQRDLDVARCRRIANKFDWAAFSPPKVVERRKGYAIIDGGTRYNAVKMVYPEGALIPCQVVPCKSVEGEAETFIKSSTNSKNLTPNNIFKALVVAGNEAAIDIVKTLRSRGISVSYGRGNHCLNETKCPAAFYEAYRTTGKNDFRLLVDIIRQYERPDRDDEVIENEALKSVFVQGMASFISNAKSIFAEQNFSNDQLKRGLKNGLSAAEIMDKVRALENGRTGRTTRNQLVIRAITNSLVKGIAA